MSKGLGAGWTLLIAASGCGTAPAQVQTVPARPTAKVAIEQTTPASGARLTADSRLQVLTNYSVPGFQAGKDRLVLIAQVPVGEPHRLKELTLTQANGRATVEVLAVELPTPRKG
jgi:hypothetical protein